MTRHHAQPDQAGVTPGATPRLLDVLTSPWAIIPEKLLEIQAIYMTHLRGDKIDLERVQTAVGRPLENERKAYAVDRGVAVIPIEGIIAKRMNLFTRISGGVSTQLLARDIQAALDDPEVAAILLDVDSPGGTVDGTEELAGLIASARDAKPIVAYTDGMMASAAYWIGSSAGLVYISGDTPMVGSIGVVTSHVDYSGYEAQVGIKTTEIYAGKYKRIASGYAPLTDEGRSYLQDQVDYIYSIFATTVASNRPEKLSLPEEGAIPWADGKIFTGRQALAAGLVDGVATKDQLVAMLSSDPGLVILRARVDAKIQSQRERRTA